MNIITKIPLTTAPAAAQGLAKHPLTGASYGFLSVFLGVDKQTQNHRSTCEGLFIKILCDGRCWSLSGSLFRRQKFGICTRQRWHSISPDGADVADSMVENATLTSKRKRVCSFVLCRKLCWVLCRREASQQLT